MKLSYLNTFVFAFLIAASFSSCRKNQQIISSEKTTARTAGDGDLDVLGYGYDIDGIYADARSSKGHVIDVAKIRQLDPNRVQSGIVSNQDFLMYSGKDVNEYRREVTAKFEAKINVLLFSSTINSKFIDENFTSSTYSYATLDKLIIRRKLVLYISNQDIKNNYLTANFLSDCQQMSAEQLVQNYGTHVLRNITLGGKLRMIYRSQINNSDKKRRVEAGVNLNGMKIFGAGVSVDGSITYNNNEIVNNSHQQINYQTVGGDPTLNLTGNVDLQAPIGPSLAADLTSWQSSVTLQNSQLIDIDKDGLIPLYDLIPGDKSQEVKKYILEKYYKAIHGSDYFLTGDLVLFDRWQNMNSLGDYNFLLMKFPDRFRIIDDVPGQLAVYTNSAFPNVKIFNDPSPDGFNTFSFDEFGGGLLQLTKKNNTIMVLNAGHFINEAISSDDKNEIYSFRDNELLYPKKMRAVDLIKDSSNDNTYMRLTTTEPGGVPKVIIYPLPVSVMFKYNFSPSRFVPVSNIDGYELGPTF